jgi:hypothetical protein
MMGQKDVTLRLRAIGSEESLSEVNKFGEGITQQMAQIDREIYKQKLEAFREQQRLEQLRRQDTATDSEEQAEQLGKLVAARAQADAAQERYSSNRKERDDEYFRLVDEEIEKQVQLGVALEANELYAKKQAAAMQEAAEAGGGGEAESVSRGMGRMGGAFVLGRVMGQAYGDISGDAKAGQAIGAISEAFMLSRSVSMGLLVVGLEGVANAYRTAREEETAFAKALSAGAEATEKAAKAQQTNFPTTEVGQRDRASAAAAAAALPALKAEVDRAQKAYDDLGPGGAAMATLRWIGGYKQPNQQLSEAKEALNKQLALVEDYEIGARSAEGKQAIRAKEMNDLKLEGLRISGMQPGKEKDLAALQNKHAQEMKEAKWAEADDPKRRGMVDRLRTTQIQEFQNLRDEQDRKDADAAQKAADKQAKINEATADKAAKAAQAHAAWEVKSLEAMVRGKYESDLRLAQRAAKEKAKADKAAAKEAHEFESVLKEIDAARDKAVREADRQEKQKLRKEERDLTEWRRDIIHQRDLSERVTMASTAYQPGFVNFRALSPSQNYAAQMVQELRTANILLSQIQQEAGMN